MHMKKSCFDRNYLKNKKNTNRKAFFLFITRLSMNANVRIRIVHACVSVRRRKATNTFNHHNPRR